MKKKSPLFSVGPWEAIFHTRDESAHVVDYMGHLVAGMTDSLHSVRTDDANAKLIACAPEMYDMLEMLQDDYEEGSEVHGLISTLLAKARGEK